MYKRGEWAELPYPESEAMPQGCAGRSFHNGRFVQRLRQKAATVDLVTIRQGAVKRLVTPDGGDWGEGQLVGGVAYRRAGEEADRIARSLLTVVCEGMYSGLRSKMLTERPPVIETPSFFVGFILKGCKLPDPERAVVVLSNPSPILFYPISSEDVRCLVDVPGTKLPSASDGSLAAHLASLACEIPECLRSAFVAGVEEGGFRSVQNKTLSADPQTQAGALLLGDAYNMRHPLTGGGMTVAFNDVALLCELLQSGPCNLACPQETLRSTGAYFTARKPLAATINTLANALYQVFCDTGETWSEEMRQACFDYLRLGGVYAQGPISLLSGLNPRPAVLVIHFFMVALYGVGRVLRPFPTPRKLALAGRLLLGATRIILPIVRNEGVLAVVRGCWAARHGAVPAEERLRRASDRNSKAADAAEIEAEE